MTITSEKPFGTPLTVGQAFLYAILAGYSFAITSRCPRFKEGNVLSFVARTDVDREDDSVVNM